MPRPALLIALLLLALAGCWPAPAPQPAPIIPPPVPPAVTPPPPEPPKFPLREARRGFQTKLTKQLRGKGEPDEPPPDLFQLVRYPAPLGPQWAYVTPGVTGAAKRPAIVWLFGGFSNGIGRAAWAKGRPENDQSAHAFRDAGIVMMFPSLRGSHDNPGVKEGFFGEVDDVIAAGEYLASLPQVDPKRVYLGGHSTGGTLALLTAAATDRFRAVFSLGPVEDVAGYGANLLPFDAEDERERELRAPATFVPGIRQQVYIFEGETGNIDSLHTMAKQPHSPTVRFYPVLRADHFSVIDPVCRLIAAKVSRATAPDEIISFTTMEVRKLIPE